MEYRISITGMHCAGCKTLMTMSLEDVGFTTVKVDDAKHEASFISDLSNDKVKAKLDAAFNDLKDYSYQLI